MSDIKLTGEPLLILHLLYEEKRRLTESKRLAIKKVSYRQVLGSLLCLSTRTHLDISTATLMLAKFQMEPSVQHWKTMEGVIRNLIQTKNFEIFLPAGCSKQKVELVAWSQADWERD